MSNTIELVAQREQTLLNAKRVRNAANHIVAELEAGVPLAECDTALVTIRNLVAQLTAPVGVEIVTESDASNHPELLDRAVWRRFQLRIELPMPTRQQLTQHIECIGKRCQTNFGYAPETLAKHMLGLNFAEVEEFCLSVVRRAVLDRMTDNAQGITKKKLEQWNGRLMPVSNVEIANDKGK